jgi:hypothetical protein
MIAVLLSACFGVTAGPGWSEPVVVTDSANTVSPYQYIYNDTFGRNHLLWSGFNDESRIAYKMFSTYGGTELYPETMISNDVDAAYLTTVVTGDSLYAFWRSYTPVFTAARTLVDGTEVLSATYLFTSSTYVPQIRASADSLGRLHVLYDGGSEGADVFYEIWSPSPDSGFTVEHHQHIEEAWEGGSILVDGDRVHIVVQDSVYMDFLYLQYDLDGNTAVPVYDFTPGYDIANCGRFPKLQVDSSGDLLVIEEAYFDPYEAIYLWKLDGETGNLLINMEPLVIRSMPELNTSDAIVVQPLPDSNQFYLCWACGYDTNRIYYLIFASDGTIIQDWQIAYDYSDEDPEDTKIIDGITDNEGNLYIVFRQGETEPCLGSYPTFGWFDYSTLGIEESSPETSGEATFSVSQNPANGSVTILSPSAAELQLKVFDIAGREVAAICVSDGVGLWNGTGVSGESLPAGVYSIVTESGFSHRITLLDN